MYSITRPVRIGLVSLLPFFQSFGLDFLHQDCLIENPLLSPDERCPCTHIKYPTFFTINSTNSHLPHQILQLPLSEVQSIILCVHWCTHSVRLMINLQLTLSALIFSKKSAITFDLCYKIFLQHRDGYLYSICSSFSSDHCCWRKCVDPNRPIRGPAVDLWPQLRWHTQCVYGADGWRSKWSAVLPRPLQ